MNSATICLLVTDDAFERAIVGERLRGQMGTVFEADGAEALSLAEKLKPDYVVFGKTTSVDRMQRFRQKLGSSKTRFVHLKSQGWAGDALRLAAEAWRLGVRAMTLPELITLFATAKNAALQGNHSPEAADSHGSQHADTDRETNKGGKVFISYRRKDGSEIARLVGRELQADGWKTCLDVDDLGANHFDDGILRKIEDSDCLVLILTPGSLDRCADPGDWLRREITHALKHKLGIVPIFKDGFSFPPPESLPEEIREITRFNAVKYNHDYFPAMIQRLLKFLDDARQNAATGKSPERPSHPLATSRP